MSGAEGTGASKWPMVPLGEVVRIKTGKLDANASSPDGKYPFFTCAIEPLKIDRWAYDEDAILVAGNGDLNVKHYSGKFEAYQRTYIISAKNREILDTRFLFHFMDIYVEQLRSQSIGGVIKYIKMGMLTEAKFPLPPLEEQKRIAAILDKANALRRLRRQALDRLNSLGQAIFHEMFGDNEQQTVLPLSKVADLINGDRSSNYPSGSDIVGQGVLFLSTKNLTDQELDFSTKQFITKEKYKSLSRGHLQRGDIVITLRGTLGQTAVFDCEYDHGFINAQLMIIRPKENVSTAFLHSFLAMPSTQSELKRGQSGSAVQQLTSKQVGELKISLPSINQQHEYVGRLKSARATQIDIKRQQNWLDSLFASLQQRAFRGDL